jgi:hypothetical protein
MSMILCDLLIQKQRKKEWDSLNKSEGDDPRLFIVERRPW